MFGFGNEADESLKTELAKEFAERTALDKTWRTVSIDDEAGYKIATFHETSADNAHGLAALCLGVHMIAGVVFENGESKNAFVQEGFEAATYRIFGNKCSEKSWVLRRFEKRHAEWNEAPWWKDRFNMRFILMLLFILITTPICTYLGVYRSTWTYSIATVGVSVLASGILADKFGVINEYEVWHEACLVAIAEKAKGESIGALAGLAP